MVHNAERDAGLFDLITAKAKEIVAFHMVSHGLAPEFTPEEADALELGMSSGIHAAIEHFIKEDSWFGEPA